MYVESDASSDEDVSKGELPYRKCQLTGADGRKPRKSLKADDSDDEFVFDAADDAALGEL